MITQRLPFHHRICWRETVDHLLASNSSNLCSLNLTGAGARDYLKLPHRENEQWLRPVMRLATGCPNSQDKARRAKQDRQTFAFALVQS